MRSVDFVKRKIPYIYQTVVTVYGVSMTHAFLTHRTQNLMRSRARQVAWQMHRNVARIRHIVMGDHHAPWAELMSRSCITRRPTKRNMFCLVELDRWFSRWGYVDRVKQNNKACTKLASVLKLARALGEFREQRYVNGSYHQKQVSRMSKPSAM